METFTYLAGFATLILGLAIARVLQGLADLTEERARVRFDWIPMWWMLSLIGYCALHWWFILRWRTFDAWTFGHFYFLLIQPAVLYYQACLVVPNLRDTGDIDLREHFERVRPYFYALYVAYLLLDVIDTALKGMEHFRSLGPQYPVMMAAFMGLMLSGMFVRRRGWHVALAGASLASLTIAYASGAMTL